MAHFNGPWLETIRWRPDGQLILFDARPNGHSAIFTMPAIGGRPAPIVEEDYEARRPNWSRDGNSIHFDFTRDGKPQIWKQAVATRVNRLLAQSETLFPSESVDGSTLFYQDGQEFVWSSSPNGEHPVRLSALLRPQPDLDWFVIATKIYYATATGTSAVISSYRIADGATTRVGDTAGPLAIGTPSLVISPDER